MTTMDWQLIVMLAPLFAVLGMVGLDWLIK